MSSAAALPRALRLAARPVPQPGEPLRASAARLIAFAALAAYAVGHWARLVADPPLARFGGALLIALALGAALTALGHSRLSGPVAHCVAGVLTVIGGVLALLAVGLPADLLAPSGWGELGGRLHDGLEGIQTAGWPYAGPDDSVTLVLVTGAAPPLIAAAALASWPARRGAAGLRVLGLLLLLLVYGVSVTDHDPGRPLLRGLVLLGLVAAWLWLPSLRGRDARSAGAAVLCVALLSLPLAARLDGAAALVDYGNWNWFGRQDVTFDWNHSYGPLDWPRRGTTLLEVKARRPHYWKAQTLDRFDGIRWLRSDLAERGQPFDELPPRPDPRWIDSIQVTVRSLETDFLIGAGTPYRVLGAGEALSGAADGTVRRLDEPLRRDDSYTVRTYDPHPGARRLRLAPSRYDPVLARYTAIQLPSPASSRGAGRPRQTVRVALVGGAAEGTRTAARRLARSPYARTFRLARRLAAAAPSVFDATKRIETHLRTNLSYGERPPRRRFPLEAFLFRDKVGYCQQFSGAMALMLRMLGIPARVVSGFSPGSFNAHARRYRVRDLDAHSWVEVYFGGVGWVTFDPTPAAAPADRPADRSDPSRTAGDNPGGASSSGDRAPERGGRDTSAAASPDRGSGGAPVWPFLAIALALAAAAALAGLRRGRASPAAPDAALRELERALRRLGWEMGPRTTLLELERRLGRAAGPRAAAYLARLRADRFAGASGGPPPPAERRALRRELTAAGGLRTRIVGLVALPPGRQFSRP